MTRKLLFFSVFLILFQGCSTERLAVRMAGPLMEGQYTALMREPDPYLAEQALPSSLKLLEGLLESDPENLSIMYKLAEGFCNYSFSFVEEDDPERASALYLRGRDYGLRALKLQGVPGNLIERPLDEFKSSLQALDKQHLQGLYWMNQCWASWLMLNLDNLEALAAISKLEMGMNRVMEWDESFHFAGPHLFLGGFYGGRSKMLGGEPEKARKHFERAIILTDQKFLMAHVLFAKLYAIQAQDRDLFERLLNFVMDAHPDINPDQRLANEVAKLKAQRLLEDADDYF